MTDTSFAKPMRVPVEVPHDFDPLWSSTVESALTDLAVIQDVPDEQWSSTAVTVTHLVLRSLGGAHVHAWLLWPKAQRVKAALLHLPGYSATANNPVLMRIGLQLAEQGFAVLNLDPRGQGASKGAHEPAPEGKLLTGIASPHTHIYRGIVADCTVAATHLAERTGLSQIGVMGNSQGGGLALMTASVLSSRVGAVSAMLPFLTHYAYQVQIRPTAGPYQEIVRYLDAYPERRDDVLRVLSHFDTLAHAPRVQAPALLSVGLIDQTCPPQSVVTLHACLPGLKGLLTFPGMGHVNAPEFYPHIVHWHALHLQARTRTLKG